MTRSRPAPFICRTALVAALAGISLLAAPFDSSAAPAAGGLNNPAKPKLEPYQLVKLCRLLITDEEKPATDSNGDRRLLPSAPPVAGEAPSAAPERRLNPAPSPGMPAAQPPAATKPKPRVAPPGPAGTRDSAAPANTDAGNTAVPPPPTNATEGSITTPPQYPTRVDVLRYCRSPSAWSEAPPPTREDFETALAGGSDTARTKRVGLSSSSFMRDSVTVAGFPSVGWQSQVIDGMMTFFLDRAKNELLNSALADWRKDLCGPPSPDKLGGATLLPDTCYLLNNIPSDNLPNLGTAFRAAFMADLEKMPSSVLLFMVDYVTKHKGDFPADSEILIAVEILKPVEELFVAVRKGTPPLKHMARWKTQYSKAACLADSNDKKAAVQCALHVVGWISSQQLGLGSASATEDIEQLVQLIVHQYIRPEFPSLARTLTDETVAMLVDTLQETANEVRALLGTANSDPGKRVLLYNSLNTILLNTAKTTLALIPETSLAPDLKTKILAMLRQLLDAEKGVIEGDYGKVALSGIRFVQSLLDVLSIKGVKVPEQLVRLVNLAADVATAKNAEEVRKAFESAASPLGSYRAKRVPHALTVSISSFLGVSGGLELLASPDDRRGFTGQFGAAGLVGVDANWGVGCNMSLGLLLSVFDLGALLSYRLVATDPAVRSAPEIGFAQIVSPGGFVVWGLSNKVPLVLALGAQMTPNLRSVSPAGEPSYQTHALRLSAMLAVDVTFLKF